LPQPHSARDRAARRAHYRGARELYNHRAAARKSCCRGRRKIVYSHGTIALAGEHDDVHHKERQRVQFSFRIGRLLGFDVRIHLLFVLLLVWLGLEHSGDGIAMLLLALASYGGLFSFVLLHELGHCVAARRLGVRVLDITLWPLGGLARFARIPEDPRKELLITAAGPLVNVAIAVVLVGVAVLLRLPLGVRLDEGFRVGDMLDVFILFIGMNVFMAVFNLIPALPLDGGRILRALLARRRGYYPATRIAVRVSRVLSVAGVAWAVWAPSLLIGLIAVFVWVTATKELLFAQLREIERRIKGPEEPEPAAARRQSGFESSFPGLSPDRRAALEEALERLRRRDAAPPDSVSGRD
jgi:Zn-dependent protease